MYGKIINGKIVYAPKNFVTSNGALIINFNKNIELMKKHGFLEVEDVRPVYNPNYQEIIPNGYDISDNKIKVLYMVIDIPTSINLRETISLEERVTELELMVEELTRKLNEE